MTFQNSCNPGTPLDLDWVMGAHVNKSAVERRVESLTKRQFYLTGYYPAKHHRPTG